MTVSKSAVGVDVCLGPTPTVTPRREIRDDDGMTLLLDPVYRLPRPLVERPPAEPIPDLPLIWPCDPGYRAA